MLSGGGGGIGIELLVVDVVEVNRGVFVGPCHPPRNRVKIGKEKEDPEDKQARILLLLLLQCWNLPRKASKQTRKRHCSREMLL